MRGNIIKNICIRKDSPAGASIARQFQSIVRIRIWSIMFCSSVLEGQLAVFVTQRTGDKREKFDISEKVFFRELALRMLENSTSIRSWTRFCLVPSIKLSCSMRIPCVLFGQGKDNN